MGYRAFIDTKEKVAKMRVKGVVAALTLYCIHANGDDADSE